MSISDIGRGLNAVERRQELQDYSLRVTMMSMANALLQSAALTLYAWEGDMAWPVLVAFVPLALGVPLLFFLFIGSGLSQRIKESTILPIQAVVACSVQLGFLMVAPQLSLLFLVGIMITFNIFMLGTKPGHLTRAWLILGVSAGVALWLVRGRFRYPDMNDLGLYAVWLYFFLAVRQLTALGVEYGTLWSLLYQRTAKLSQTVAKLHEHAGDERVLERERISRELHDTLLQGVQAMVLRIHAASEGIPKDQLARGMIDRALARADHVMVDARERLTAMRDGPCTDHDMTKVFAAGVQNLANDFGVRFDFRVTGEYKSDQIDGEAIRLGRDTMINAFRQTGVQFVNIRLHYGAVDIVLWVREERGEFELFQVEQLYRDDLLARLMERAGRLGAEMSVSNFRHGQEVCLKVPDEIAYRARAPSHGSDVTRRALRTA